MHERDKLEEARFFLARMDETIADPSAFRYHLSAFLSAARSVLQYAKEEASKKPKGEHWYNTAVAGNQILAFFKDKRDINIHQDPVRPSRHVSVESTVHVGVSVSMTYVLRQADGTVVEEGGSEPQPKKPLPPSTTKTTYRASFKDWSGNEDVLALSQQYIDALQTFIEDGTKKAFISG
jgi:hypothetical protein